MLSRLQKNGQLFTDKTGQTYSTVTLLQRKMSDLSHILSQVMEQLEIQSDEISLLKERCSAVESCNQELRARADTSEKTAEKLQKAVLRVTKGLTEVANSTFTSGHGTLEPVVNEDRKLQLQPNSSTTSGTNIRRPTSSRSSTQKPRRSVSINDAPNMETERISLNHTSADIPVPNNLRSQTLKLSHLSTIVAPNERDTSQVAMKGGSSHTNIVQNMNARRVMADGRVLERIKLI